LTALFVRRARDAAAPLLLAIAALAFGAVGVAVYTQHAWGMLPCPWCILQRIVLLLIGAVALLGLPLRGWPRLLATVGLLLLGLAGLAAAL
jgi:protein dithiol:quinone oxidoreductase